MWLERFKQTDGYILLEAMISMSILIFLLAGTMPYFVDLFEVRYQAKNKVEISRFLYESSLFWEREETVKTVTSGNSKAVVIEEASKISIKGEDGSETEVELFTIIWAE